MLQLLFIVAVAFTGLSDGFGVLPDGPLNASVGGTAMFRTNLNPTETPFLSISWHYGPGSEPLPIIISQPTSNTTAPGYEDRITLFTSTGSLDLRNLNFSDSGEYGVSIQPIGDLPKTGRTTLDIYEPVSDVRISSLSTDLVEFNSSIHLSCSSSGSSLSFIWMNSSSDVTAGDRVQITDGGSNLTITNVTRYDRGSYRCRVFNPVSSIISDPVNISVSYGPDNVQIEVHPSKQHHEIGSDISLICSADSTPSAEFLWFLNGDQLSNTGPELRLMNIQMNQSGNYSCQAFNSKTLRYQTSQPSAVFVHEPVSGVRISSLSTDLVELISSVHLHCSSSGSSLSFIWMNSSSDVTAGDRVQITDGGSNLTIINVTRYDQGSYRCLVSNPVSNASSDQVHLSVSYGPENVRISKSQKQYEKGSDVLLSCSADSRPPATFQWLMNGHVLPSSGSELKLINVQSNQSGNYSCRAFNNRTLVYQTSEIITISVAESNTLHAGAIAGIVIACLVGTSLIVFGVYYILKKKKRKGNPSNRSTSTITGGDRRHNTASTNEELNYADVKFSKNINNGKVQWGLENDSSNYADIRVNNN
ncbi:hypothetical protein AMECASPLE_023130 [Ameca splendens]|uniref:Ig-like domain-containing protein n=1 Tax=Ameca splendens TaxID=208324 RepID=A0ABV0YFD6_9TELE